MNHKKLPYLGYLCSDISTKTDARPMSVKLPISLSQPFRLIFLMFSLGILTPNIHANDFFCHLSPENIIEACPIDTVPPVIINCPSDTTIVFDASLCGAVYVWDSVIAMDACTSIPLVTLSYQSGDTFHLEATTVLVTALDSAGLSTTCTFDVTLSSVQFNLFGCPGNVYKDADADCQAVATWNSPFIVDNCGSTTSLDSTHVSGSKFDIDTTVVTYTLTNDLGNLATCSFNVIVKDVTPPLLLGCSLDTTIYPTGCFGVYLWDEDAIIVQDNCNAVKIPDPTYHSGFNFPMGTTTITYKAIDSGSNMTECSFDVTVVDTVAPFATYCPTDTTAILYTTCDSFINWTDAIFFDGCAMSPVVTVNQTNGGNFSVGTYEIIYSAKDADNNIGHCVFNLTVKDNTPPVMTACPTDTTLYVNNACSATYNYILPTASDLCSGSITPIATPSNTNFTIGNQLVTISATDSGGNTSSCSFVVMTRDTTLPTTICPQGIEINTDGTVTSDPDNIVQSITTNGCNEPTIYFNLPSISDNCNVMLVDSTILVDSFPIGSTLHSYSFSDFSGNASACSFAVVVTPLQQTITISSSQNPVCPNTDVTLSTSVTDPTADYMWSGPFSFVSNSRTPTIASFSYGNVGEYMVTVTQGGCILQPTDPLQVDIAKDITANDDSFTIPINTTDSLGVTINDDLFGQFSVVQIDQAPLNGAASTEGSKVVYTPDVGYSGADQLFYTVCIESCPTICSSAQVNIEINLSAGGDTCIIPNLISPNDDNLNDELILDCLGTTSELSKIIIYNQWGSQVYEAAPYLNDWKGSLSGNDSQPLPDGTYFYIFWKDTSKEPQKGFITIFR